MTIAEVARQAGVSESTVSYVLSGKRRISRATTLKVEAAIRAVGYHPNAGARALASRRSQILGLVMPASAYFAAAAEMEFVHAVTRAARGHGYDVLLLSAEEGSDGLVRVARSGLADGVILMEVSASDPRSAVARRLNLPTSLIGHPTNTGGTGWVDLDFGSAAAVCLEHLAGLGHRTIGFLGPNNEAFRNDMGYAVRARAGALAAARRLGLRLWNRRTSQSRANLTKTLRTMLEQRPRPTALLVHDQAALPVVDEVLRMDGIAVPDDLSLTAITLPAVAERVSIPLSHVDIPVQAMAEEGVRLVVDEIEGRPTREVLLAPVLHHRGVTASRERRSLCAHGASVS